MEGKTDNGDVVADIDKSHGFLNREKVEVVEELDAGFKGANNLEWIHGKKKKHLGQ